LVVGIVRRNRLRLVIWLVAVPGVTLPSLGAYGTVFGTETGAKGRALIMATPTGTIFGGPGYGLDNYTMGAMVANELLIWLNVTIALAAILLMVHLTRHEEDTGRLELVGAAAVGRAAPLTAALTVVAGEVILISLALGFGMMAYPELAKVDCLALGLAVAATGLTFTGVGAVMAQLAWTGRAAAGLSCAVLGVAYALRAVGDTLAVQGGSGWASWLSPLGWAAQGRIWVNLRWWPLLLGVACGAALTVLALILAGRRDQGAAILPEIHGPARADKALKQPSSLVWRRIQASFLAWSFGVVAVGAAMGPAMGSLADYVRDNPAMMEFFGLDKSDGIDPIAEAFSGMVVLYLAVIMGAFGITAMNQMHSDELTGLVARSLEQPVSRDKLLGANELTVALSTLLGMGLGGVAYYGAVVSNRELDPGVAPAVAEAVLRSFPGLVATVALASFLVAVLPRLTALSWPFLAYPAVHQLLSTASDWPAWTRLAAPLSAASLTPGTPFDWRASIGLFAVAALLISAAHQRFRERDLLA
jgi:ABC-2 type transport system permease protein